MSGKREQGLLICMPLGRCPHSGHIERECFVCHGKVGINPQTFEGKNVPANLQPICGACAIDLIDSDGGLDKHEFRATESQAELIEAIESLKGKNWPKAAVEHVRRNRSLYDARPPGPVRTN